MINQEACICKSITHYLYDSLRNTLIPLQGDQTFIMKNKQPKNGLTQDERHRVDRAVNRQILVPKYRKTDKK